MFLLGLAIGVIIGAALVLAIFIMMFKDFSPIGK